MICFASSVKTYLMGVNNIPPDACTLWCFYKTIVYAGYGKCFSPQFLEALKSNCSILFPMKVYTIWVWLGTLLDPITYYLINKIWIRFLEVLSFCVTIYNLKQCCTKTKKLYKNVLLSLSYWLCCYMDIKFLNLKIFKPSSSTQNIKHSKIS